MSLEFVVKLTFTAVNFLEKDFTKETLSNKKYNEIMNVRTKIKKNMLIIEHNNEKYYDLIEDIKKDVVFICRIYQIEIIDVDDLKLINE